MNQFERHEARLHGAFHFALNRMPDPGILAALEQDGCSPGEARKILDEAKGLLVARARRLAAISFIAGAIVVLACTRMNPNDTHELPALVLSICFSIGTFVAAVHWLKSIRSWRSP